MYGKLLSIDAMSNPKKHIAIYGNTGIRRELCSRCRRYAFVVSGKMACCDLPVEEPPVESLPLKRMSAAPRMVRKRPSRDWQEAILKEQEEKCFYCNLPFESEVYRGNRAITLKLHWDHVNPYVYSLDNKDQNFVAACHVCNLIKHCFIFGSADEARIYITEKRKEKGYTSILPERELPKRVYSKEVQPEVLHSKLPPAAVVQKVIREGSIRPCKTCGIDMLCISPRKMYCTQRCGLIGWAKRVAAKL